MFRNLIFCSIIYSYEISAATGTTINSNAREYLVRHELVNSKKSQGLRGSGGGANIVRQPRTVKSNAVSLIQVLSFYLSVCISFIVFLVLCSDCWSIKRWRHVELWIVCAGFLCYNSPWICLFPAEIWQTSFLIWCVSAV